MFKKPKKINSRRVFSYEDEEAMEVDADPEITVKHSTSSKDKKKDKKDKEKPNAHQKSSLLSFADNYEEEDCEVFKVKKSRHSKMLERRKKKNQTSSNTSSSSAQIKDSSNISPNLNSINLDNSVKPDNSTETNNSNLIQKEIRTAGIVLVVKNSDPDVILLNGRAALCAGKDDLSSEEENESLVEKKSGNVVKHKFSQPDNLNFMLENGKIPDASMIHEARKRRQKARELGDYVTIEEPPEDKKGKRIMHEDEEVDGSDEDEQRVDMLAITSHKEREERREKFYSVQQEYSGEDSDLETNEWENQQIRKGVTGAQLMSAHQESSMFSQYMIHQPFSNTFNNMSIEAEKSLTTAELLEQAYSHINYEINKKSRKPTKANKDSKNTGGPKTPSEIMKLLSEKLDSSKELNRKHFNDIDRITTEMQNIKIDLVDCEKNAPVTAAKYKFYQEIKCYVSDLVECFNEKVGVITHLEERAMNIMGKYSQKLIERRHQDVRDQASEVIETKKRINDDEERVRRSAEREGRRTRRRRDREKNGLSNSHFDGFSSDDEVPDVDYSQYRSQIAQIKNESMLLFDDVSEEYCELPEVLKTFEEWKLKEINSYKEAYVHLCLPKICGTIIRPRLVLWNPFDDNFEDIEKMQWFHLLALYGRKKRETEDDLRNDPDLFLVPIVIEKIILPKLTRIIQDIWDPLSTTQTLKMIGLLRKLQNDYPSVKQSSKKLHILFETIVNRMTNACKSDVFIPILAKQPQDSKNPFFQRQFYSALKLFRNILSFQGIITDSALKDLAISSILNKYLLLALRIVNPLDGISKAHMIVYTLPRIWFSIPSIMESLEMFKNYIKGLENQLDKKNPLHVDSTEKLKQIMSKLQ